MGRIGLLLLSMCFGMQALAGDGTSAQRQQTFGDTTVYYNAFPSTFLTLGRCAVTGKGLHAKTHRKQ